MSLPSAPQPSTSALPAATATTPATTHGGWFGAPPTEAQRRRRRNGRIGTAIGVVIGVVLLSLRVYFDRSSWVGLDWGSALLMIAVVAGLALIMWAALASTAAAAQRRLRAALELRPGASAFGTARTDDLVDALKQAGLPHRVPAVLTATVGTGGVELWGKAASGVPVLSLSWSAIDHVQPDHEMVSRGRSSADARAVRVFTELGTGRHTFPLPIYGERNLRFAKVDRANEVMAWFAQHARVEGTDI
ncbi:MAG: hypothetical protein FWD85_05705 [Microbacteriaceae bacterium]|nr:hypothetical protein [Microbacteriaceae bacterium]MCL2794785.1 hypothetical protein [Microbacteriaceae bacterium]